MMLTGCFGLVAALKANTKNKSSPQSTESTEILMALKMRTEVMF
jgi:hypothetical protein